MVTWKMTTILSRRQSVKMSRNTGLAVAAYRQSLPSNGGRYIFMKGILPRITLYVDKCFINIKMKIFFWQKFRRAK